MYKEYFRYVAPSTLSFLLTGVYSIVDGIFVGKAVGDSGLAGINMAWPLVALMMAFGTGIGMGGSVICSINKGAGNKENGERAEGNSIVLLLITSIILTIALLLLSKPILILFGAEGETLNQGTLYMSAISWGCIFQLVASGLVPLIRNRGNTIRAMISMMSGFITNIILDWLFVIKFQWGIQGAAVATIIGQIVTIICCLTYFVRKENRISTKTLKPKKNIIMDILKVSVSPFGLTFLPSVTIILVNWQAARYGGQQAVAVYAVLSYVLCVIELAVQGISDGSQPLISKNQGSGNITMVRSVRRLSYICTTVTGVIGGILMILLADEIPIFFGTSAEVGAMVADGFPIIACTFILYGFTRTTVSYFYATNTTTSASIMVYAEILFSAVAIIILPTFMGISGIWAMAPVAQLALSITGAILLHKNSSIVPMKLQVEK